MLCTPDICHSEESQKYGEHVLFPAFHPASWMGYICGNGATVGMGLLWEPGNGATVGAREWGYCGSPGMRPVFTTSDKKHGCSESHISCLVFYNIITTCEIFCIGLQKNFHEAGFDSFCVGFGKLM